MDFNIIIDFDIKKMAKLLSTSVEKVESIINDIKTEVKLIRERDPAATSDAEVLLLYPGLHALLAYRLANYLHGKGRLFLARAISQYARAATGIEIHPAATIGTGLFIDHGCAVVIGETTVIGNGCTIYQGVTLGGTGKHIGKRHPTIGDNVMIGAGAKVLGPINIGNHSKIAAGAVVLKDVPECSTAVGIPAKIVNKCNEPDEENNLDQVNVPDPISQEIISLKMRIKDLEDKIK
ncbi:serine O-acetyltransferase [Eubacteriales bacterium OttesenSCG-928-G02]|nr:serine O-acetyltransferase [Eubacteriales bacterium OttesenSCG-928-G02]